MLEVKKSRTWMIRGAIALLVVMMAYAFWPRPTMVDLGVVENAHLVVTVNEEAKTRVRNAYVVSAPVAGRLLRVEVEPGDPVEGSSSVVARMLPINPTALDARAKEQARANVSAAEAALRVSRADLNKAAADKDLVDLDYQRAKTLRENGTVAQAALDRAERAHRAAKAAYETARAAIAMREADLANAKAFFISATSPTSTAADSDVIEITAPVSGRVLRLMQESETTMQAGTPILEVGDTASDLEIVAELLSTDAVSVSVGDRVIIRNWGGPNPLAGVVERIEPWGFTKYSALGVEEQRVNAIIRFTSQSAERAALGHGFRVEAQIVTWEAQSALAVPASALFRQDEGWAVFVNDSGTARLIPIEVGHNTGTLAEVLSGLSGGEQVVLYPGPQMVDGLSIARREVE